RPQTCSGRADVSRTSRRGLCGETKAAAASVACRVSDADGGRRDAGVVVDAAAARDREDELPEAGAEGDPQGERAARTPLAPHGLALAGGDGEASHHREAVAAGGRGPPLLAPAGPVRGACRIASAAQGGLALHPPVRGQLERL